MALAPAGPEAGLSLGLILLGAACVFLLALNKVYRFTVGALLASMALMVAALPKVTVFGQQVPPWDALAKGITDLNNYVLEGIGSGIQWTEKGLHALVGAMTWLLQETADQVAGLAEDTARAFDWVKRSALPVAINAALLGPRAAISLLQSQVGQLLLHPVHAVRTTVRVIAPGLQALEGKVSALEARVAAIGAAAPAAIPQILPPISVPKPAAIPGEISSGLDSLWKRVRGFGRTLTPAGIVGLVAGATLAQLGLSWLKCGNVGKVGKRVCGLNAGVLDSLLAGLVVVFGTIGLVKFAEDVQGVTEAFSGDVAEFWRATAPGPGGDRVLGQKGA